MFFDNLYTSNHLAAAFFGIFSLLLCARHDIVNKYEGIKIKKIELVRKVKNNEKGVMKGEEIV